MTTIHIGTCGYSRYDPPEGWKEEYPSKLGAYADNFDLVEINRTFYELPKVGTTERWLEEIEDGRRADGPFHVALKAWQVLTHPISSPTWRDRDDDIDGYDYDYSDAELEELAATLEGLSADHERVYRLFNYYEMCESATRLEERLDAER